MPWSAKAQELLRSQYAAVGASARAALVRRSGARKQRSSGAACAMLPAGAPGHAQRFVDAYSRYCWNVETLDDLKLAPFQILAGESGVYIERDHAWHMGTIARIAEADEGLLATRVLAHDVWPPGQRGRDALVGGHHGRRRRGHGGQAACGHRARPARAGAARRKVPRREYLRIIYGPEYTMPEHLERLRERNLSHKRSLAVREFALGIEALERFVRKEPLRRVHECVFGVLALESEPVDPRL